MNLQFLELLCQRYANEIDQIFISNIEKFLWQACSDLLKFRLRLRLVVSI